MNDAGFRTPDQIINHAFQVVRFKEGYDAAEVDDFLDGIVQQMRAYETTIVELERENAALRSGFPPVGTPGTGGPSLG